MVRGRSFVRRIQQAAAALLNSLEAGLRWCRYRHCRRDTLNLFRNRGFQLESFITNRHHLSSSTPNIIIPYVFQATDAVYPERMRSIPTDAVYPERMLGNGCSLSRTDAL